MLRAIMQTNRVDAILSALLLLGGLYLGISWFLGYVWAGIWNEGLLQNAFSIVVCLFYVLAWLGYLMGKNSIVAYRMTVLMCLILGTLLAWNQFGQRILVLRADTLDLIFVAVVLTLMVSRKHLIRTA